MKKILSAVTFAVFLSACGGGGGGSSQQVGQFIDDPVSGLTYSCVSTGSTQEVKGTTDADGHFNYLPGQTCTFKVGNVTLGSLTGVPADGKVTPQDVAGVSRSATAAPSALAIAQFLQSLNDGTTNGRIVIPAATTTALSSVTAITLVSSTGTVSQADLQTVVAAAGKTLVTASAAQSALDTQIASGAVSASSGSISASAPVTLNSILVTSSVDSNAAGLTETFTATGYYSDGSKGKLTSGVTWTSSDTSVVTLADNVGTGKKVGTSRITASVTPNGASTAVTGSMTQTTTEATVTNLAISFVKGVIASITSGAEEAIQAIATYTDQTTKTVSTAVTWVIQAATGSTASGEVTKSGDTATFKAGSIGVIDIVAQYLGLTSNKLSPEITTKITGVVAIGAALPDATVTLTDKNGQKATATTNSAGYFEVVNSAGQNLIAPFVLSTTKTLGDKVYELYSVATNNFQTANITPLTTATVALINSGSGYDPTAVDLNQFTQSTMALAIDAANKKLAAALKPLLTDAQISDYQPISSSFTANNAGLDKVIDQVGLNISSSGLSLVNKFEVLTDGGKSTPVSISAATTSQTELKLGASPPDNDMVRGFIAKMEACFKIDASKRISYTTDGVGRDIYTPGTLHETCGNFVRDEYRHQGMRFGQRWITFLKDSQFDGSKFTLVPLYVVDKKNTFIDSNNTQPFPGDDQLAYVYNILLTDKNGLIYTSPDVLIKDNKQFKLMGNRRKFNVSIQPYFTKVKNFRDANDEYTEARIRPGVDPSFTFDSSAGFGKFYSTTDGKQPLPKILCAWVTGPLLQNGVSHDPNAPKGGVMLKPAWSEVTQRQDYMAPRVKYPFDFDPINNSTNKAQLLSDCKNPHTDNGVRYQATPETNSTFATDWAINNSKSTRSFGYTWLAKPYPTSYNRFDNGVTACPTSTNGVAIDKVAGWCNPTKRETSVTDAERAEFETTYADPKNIVFTFYLFIDETYSEASPGTTKFSNTTAFPSSGESFLASAEVMQIRMAGTLAFLDKKSENGKNIYTSIKESYLSIDDTTLSKYLAADLKTISKDTVVDFSWQKSYGDMGGDRLGIGGWWSGKKCSGCNISRIGDKTYSDSFAIDKSKNTVSIKLPEDWYGFDHLNSNNLNAGAGYRNYTHGYREIWIRSYDKHNRVLQTVVNSYQ